MADVKRLAARDDDFGTGGVTFEVSSPIHVEQLDAEMQEALGWRVTSGLVLDGGRIGDDGTFAPVPADEDRGEDPDPVMATVTVTHRGAADAVKEITGVLKAHKPDPDWAGESGDLDALTQAATERVLLPEEAALAVTLLLRERADTAGGN